MDAETAHIDLTTIRAQKAANRLQLCNLIAFIVKSRNFDADFHNKLSITILAHMEDQDQRVLERCLEGGVGLSVYEKSLRELNANFAAAAAELNNTNVKNAKTSGDVQRDMNIMTMYAFDLA